MRAGERRSKRGPFFGPISDAESEAEKTKPDCQPSLCPGRFLIVNVAPFWGPLLGVGSRGAFSQLNLAVQPVKDPENNNGIFKGILFWLCWHCQLLVVCIFVSLLSRSCIFFAPGIVHYCSQL